MASPPISHSATGPSPRFFAVMDDGAEAELCYTLKDGVMDMDHTFCPPSARGKGMAGKLADAAFAWARENGVKAVLPSCSYIRDSYMPKNATGFSLNPSGGPALRT